MQRSRFVLGAACVFGLLVGRAHAGPAAAGHQTNADAVCRDVLPRNIVVDTGLQAVMVGMLEQSPAFRAQCLHLAGIARLRVVVMLKSPRDPSQGRLASRADGEMRRYEFGRIEAHVRIPSSKDAAELIAHELEHVREFVDGINFRRLSIHPGTDVWEINGGHYETARALRVGQHVATEVAGARAAALRARREPPP